MSRRRFAGRVALVTGGAGGFGRPLVHALAAEGARVAVADVALAAAEETAAEVPGALAIGLDVTDPAMVGTAVARIEAELGRLDVLVNLAGGGLGTPRDLPEIAPEDYDLVLAVNLRGTFLCCQACVPVMAGGGGGAIVNVASIAGRGTTRWAGVPYAAAKAGVLGLTRRLAREVGPLGIRVNAVAPGLFLTRPALEQRWEALGEDGQAAELAAIPLRRLPGVEEAIGPMLFLASDEASYVTGAVVDVNGGLFMGA